MASAVPNPFDTQQASTATPALSTDASGTSSIASTPQVTAQALADVPSVTASKVSVTPDQTVEGRTQGIIAANSPLMQLAETRAAQTANSRGLINSSLAAGAGQTAVLDAATNIAKQDAATSANAATTNANAENTASLANQDTSYKTSAANASNAMTAQTANQDAGIKTSTANLNAAAAQKVAGIEAQYKNLTAASASATSIMNNMSNQIASIMENTNLDASGKQAAIDTYNANAVTSLKLIGALAGDVDLSSQLNDLLA